MPERIQVPDDATNARKVQAGVSGLRVKKRFTGRSLGITDLGNWRDTLGGMGCVVLVGTTEGGENVYEKGEDPRGKSGLVTGRCRTCRYKSRCSVLDVHQDECLARYRKKAA